MSKKWAPHVYLFVTNLLFGTSYTVAKEIMPRYVLPFGMIGLRVSCAAVFFVVLNMFTGFEKIQRRDWPRLALCGLFGIALNQLSFFKGLNLTTPINAALILTTTPILILLIAFATGVEKPTLLKIAGIITGLCGAAVIIAGGKTFTIHAQGDFYVFLNAMSYALYLVMVKPLMQRYSPYTVIMYSFLLGLIVVAPVSWSDIQQADWAHIPMRIWACIAFIVIGSTILTYLFNILGIRLASPTTAGIYMYAQPIFATIIALACGKDVFTWSKAVAMLLVFAGVFMVSRTFEHITSQDEIVEV